VRLVVDAVVAKKAVVVPLTPEKFWRVDEPKVRRFVSVARPVFETEKRVDVAVPVVDEAIAKRVVVAPVALTGVAIEKYAYGVVVP
jgi:hypothetical protein